MREIAKEQALKDYLQDSERFFGIEGESAILYEKRLSQTKDKKVKPTIADALIFTENKGIIGVEIKTENDSLSRLKRQLEGYTLVCDFVWVMCHDKHIRGVEQRVKRYNLRHVGIINYSQLNGKIFGGVFQEAKQNVQKSVYHALNILWKSELIALMRGTMTPLKYAVEEGYSPGALYKKPQQQGFNYEKLASTATHEMSKPAIINNIRKRFGDFEANRLLCDIFIHNRKDPARSLTMKHFKQNIERLN